MQFRIADAVYFVDAMSSFGGVPIDIAECQIDFLVSSANKCIEGVPGWAFTIAKREKLLACKGIVSSHIDSHYTFLFHWNLVDTQGTVFRLRGLIKHSLNLCSVYRTTLFPKSHTGFSTYRYLCILHVLYTPCDSDSISCYHIFLSISSPHDHDDWHTSWLLLFLLE